MKKMLGLVVALTLIAGLTLHAAAPASVAGSWKLFIEGEDHFSMNLVLKQDGKKLTGTLSNPHGSDIILKGEFADGKITFAGKSDDGSVPDVKATGRLLDDGTLAGGLDSSGYKMNWNAKRQ